jgi:hypothetical protein
MGEYDRQIASAKRQIAKKGQAVVWWQIPDGVAADPLLPNRKTNGSPVQFPATIVFFPLTAEKYKSLTRRPETELITGAVYGLMGAVGFVPNLKDYIERGDGLRYQIDAMNVLAPNGQPILYTIVFKAGVQF